MRLRNAAWRISGGLAAAFVILGGVLLVQGTPIGGLSCAQVCATAESWWAAFVIFGCWC